METKFPKNVRQIGNVSDTPKIYVEDYVDTFINQLCDKTEETPVGAFLIGHTVRQEEQDCIYVSGAVRIEELIVEGMNISIGRDAWERAKSEKAEHFPDGEFMGWCLIRKDGALQMEEQFRRIHEQYFGHFGTIFILKNAEEEQYFAYKYKELMEMNGHYIYYEKNPSMQNYMILERKKIGVTPSENVEDKAAKEFRNIVKERIIIQEEKKQSRFMKAVSAILVIAVLAIGVTTVTNYGKMQDVQTSLERMKEMAALNNTKDNDSVEANGEITENVEITPEEPEQNQEEIPNPDANTNTGTETGQGSDETAVSTMQEMSEDIYIVQKGDTLAKISKKVYGDSSHVDAICRMNGLSDGNLIFIGQKLLLP